MGEIDVSIRPNRIQRYFVDVCSEAYGEIGGITFLRCRSCSAIVTANMIKETGKCLSCGWKMFNQTALTLWEEIKVISGALWAKFLA